MSNAVSDSKFDTMIAIDRHLMKTNSSVCEKEMFDKKNNKIRNVNVCGKLINILSIREKLTERRVYLCR